MKMIFASLLLLATLGCALGGSKPAPTEEDRTPAQYQDRRDDRHSDGEDMRCYDPNFIAVDNQGSQYNLQRHVPQRPPPYRKVWRQASPAVRCGNNYPWGEPGRPGFNDQNRCGNIRLGDRCSLPSGYTCWTNPRGRGGYCPAPPGQYPSSQGTDFDIYVCL